MRHLRDRIRHKTPVGTTRHTKQAFKDQCTVSKIVQRFAITGQMPLNGRQPLYGDFSNSMDLHTAMNTVIAAQASFDGLDPYVREAAENDPQLFASMLETTEGREILEAAGLTFVADESQATSVSSAGSDPEELGESDSEPPAPEPEPPSQ